MVHKKEKLTVGEQIAEEEFLLTLTEKRRKTKRPIIVAFIGLVGSGKSSVVNELAKHIGATVVSGDAIRIELRKQHEGYEKARAIAEHVAMLLASRDGSVILDSDFVDAKKRASIREWARKIGVRLIFIRTVCDLDVMIGRALTAPPDEFFAGASSEWDGSNQTKSAAVKVREMHRRAPQHYRWRNLGGGEWILKKFPFPIFATIDTTSESLWKDDIKTCVARLLV